MKQLKICSIIYIASGFLLSCSILDQEPQLGVRSSGAIHNKKSAEVALNGLYSELQRDGYYGQELIALSSLSSDIIQDTGSRDEYISADEYNMTTANARINDFWSAAYGLINHANAIIQKVPSLNHIDQDTKDQILGETYFLRALTYFDLNRAFGGIKGVYGTMGVPIVLKPTTSVEDVSTPSRASITDTYKRVESDLKEAVELLPPSGDIPTRASQAAAKALLSRLYLYYKQNYTLVENYATEVINDYNYKLTEKYANIFNQEETSGSIFEVTFTPTDGEGLSNLFIAPSKGGRGEVAFHRKFSDMLLSKPSDERTHLIIYRSQLKVYYPNKFNKPGGASNIPVLRLAEMYLNRAEARIKKDNPNLSGALSDLNKIRNRAGLTDTTGTGVDSPNEILHAISICRSIEFYEEGHRWFNLIRTGQALTVLQSVQRRNGANVTLRPGRQVWPIPQTAIGANPNLEQNLGYK